MFCYATGLMCSYKGRCDKNGCTLKKRDPDTRIVERFERVADRLENAAKTKRIVVVDTVKAQKALACVEELRQMILEELPCDSREERDVLMKYGFME